MKKLCASLSTRANTSKIEGDISIQTEKGDFLKKTQLKALISLAVLLINLIFITSSFASIALRGTATSATTTNSTLTINKPAGVVAGDVMIVNINQTGNITTDPTSTGWTLIDGASATASTRLGAVLYRVSNGTEGSNFTFTLGPGVSNAVGSIIAFSGVNTLGSTPFDVMPGTINATNPSGNNPYYANALSITTVTNNAAVIFLTQANSNGTTNQYINWSGSTPVFTEVMDVAAASPGPSVGAAWGTFGTAGSTGNKTVQLTGNYYYGGILIALKPVPTPGSTVTTTYSYTGSTQTFTVPNCVTSLTVEAWGGGGGGFNGSNSGGGKGGGGGGYAKSTINNASGNYTVSVGHGGGESSNGTASSFGGTTVVADYGRGGTSATNGGGAGGTSNTGNVTISNGSNGGNGNGNSDAGGGGGGAAGPDGNGIAGSDATTKVGGRGGAGDNGLGGAGGVGGNNGSGSNGISNARGGGGGGGGDNATIAGNGGFPGAGGGGGENLGGSGGDGVIIITYMLPGNPTITLGSSPSACRGTTSAGLTFSATTGCPDTYTIDYDAAANSAGFVDVTNATLSGSPITLAIPPGAAATTYSGTITVINSSYGFVSTGTAITVTVNALPSAPGAGNNSKTYTGIANATAISANPGINETIDWYAVSSGGTALLTGSNSYTPTSPINANTYTYFAEARNTITGCVSANRTGVTLAIVKATPTLSVTNSPVTYTGVGQSAAVSGSVPGAVSSILSGGAATQINVGTYAVIANFIPTDIANYNSLTAAAAGNFVINPATSTTWTGTSGTNWITPGNWSPTVPGTGISVTVPNVTNKPIISTSGNVCNNLTLDPGAILTIAYNGNLTVNGALNNTGTATDLVIQSSSSGTGSLLTKGSVTGTATVERYIGGNVWAWHFLSSPVTSQPISGGFTPSTSGYDFYTWYEPLITWVNFKNTGTPPTWSIANGSTNFVPGRGYLVAYEATNTTKNFTGTLNSGNVSYSLTRGGNTTYQYFNLVGNPYPCSIDWEIADGPSSWDRSKLDGIQKSYWVWNDAAGNYGAYITGSFGFGTNGVTNYISAGQGFIVLANTSGVFTMNDLVKVHSAQAYLKSEKTVNEELRLKLTCDANAYSDEAIIAFNDSDADGGSGKFNSMFTNAPELWSVKNGSNYSINYKGNLNSGELVPLTVKAGVPGTYTLTASQVDSFYGNSNISLEDRLKGTYIQLGNMPSYSFQVSSPETITDRFFLHFMNITGINSQSEAFKNFNAFAANGILNIQSLNHQSGKIAVFDMLGRRIATGRMEAGATTQIDMQGRTGVYIVSVLTCNGISNTKIMVK